MKDHKSDEIEVISGVMGGRKIKITSSPPSPKAGVTYRYKFVKKEVDGEVMEFLKPEPITAEFRALETLKRWYPRSANSLEQGMQQLEKFLGDAGENEFSGVAVAAYLERLRELQLTLDELESGLIEAIESRMAELRAELSEEPDQA